MKQFSKLKNQMIFNQKLKTQMVVSHNDKQVKQREKHIKIKMNTLQVAYVKHR